MLQITRAKEIASLLKVQGFQVENPWDLVRMSRDYGFTPIDKSYCIPRPLKSSENSGARYSEAHPVYDWLGSKSNEPREPQENVVIDVEGRFSPGKKGKENHLNLSNPPFTRFKKHNIYSKNLYNLVAQA